MTEKTIVDVISTVVDGIVICVIIIALFTNYFDRN